MGHSEEPYISVIGDRWLHPIVRLLEELNKYEFKNDNEVQVSEIENGYSVAIIISMVSMVESYLNKMRCIVNDENIAEDKNSVRDETPTRKYFRKYLGDTDTAKKLDELWAIRDAIIHNHIWGANTTWDNGWNLVFVDRPELVDDEFYGDNNFNNVIDKKTWTTKLLGLNFIPTKIGRGDALKVIINSYEILEHIENRNNKYCCISYLQVNFENNLMTLSEFINNLKQNGNESDNSDR